MTGKIMNQTPAHDHHNPDLLSLMPIDSKIVIEIGCSAGALAREYKKINPKVNYIGIDIDDNYVKLAEQYCDKTYSLNIESADEQFLRNNLDGDCWIFGDSLEHLNNPWELLKKIRLVIPDNGTIVACIPNAQHWSVQARLCTGIFRYEDSGLMDKTHLRWFTRQTIFELFDDSGFFIEDGKPRIFPEKNSEKFLPAIAAMAVAAGSDPIIAMEDSLPLQYVIRAKPKLKQSQ
jgi:2-polyprenyl-3-methyl-5-hydroxy-6-metoxy-1,4-benzoquinol methylase